MSYPLFIQIDKRFCQETAEYYKEWLSSHKELSNRWFAPSGDDYHLMDDLERHNLVAKRSFPIFKDGSFRGNRVLFMFRFGLNYEGEI